MSDDKPKEILKFFVGTFHYSGYIVKETKTHYIIFDTFKKKEFKLPINNTIIEEINDENMQS